MKNLILLVLLILSCNSLLSQPVEEWDLIFDGANASEYKTNISPQQLRVFDNKHLGFIDGFRSYGGYTNSLTLSDSNFKSQFKALKFKYQDSIWVIVQDWNYVNNNIIYVLADSCKIRSFDGINTFYYFKSFVLKSEDGGKSWNNILINENWRTHPSNALSMYDSKNGIIVQFPNQEDQSEKTDLMWITKDGWNTKSKLNLDPQMFAINNLKYFEPSIIIAKNLTNNVFYSRDDGTSWEVNPIPKDLILNSIDYYNFYVLNESTLYFITANNSQIDGYNHSIIAKSTNSGKTWNKIYDKTGDSSIINLSFVNDSSYYSHGIKIKYTSDNGQSWVDKSKDYANYFDTPVFSFTILPDSSKVALTYLKIYSTKTKPLGVNEYLSSGFVIYPNPVADFLYIQNYMALEKVEIYSVFGEKIATYDTPLGTLLIEGGLRLDVSGLEHGVYFVRFGNKVSKFIKM